jgi:hypothetical protein
MSDAAGGLDPARGAREVASPLEAGWHDGAHDGRVEGVTDAVRAAELATRWQSVLDGVMRGLAHAFSNRVATLGAAAYML